MSFVSLKSVISDIEFNDHLPSTISVFITSKARQNFISWLYSTTNMFVNSKARQKSNDALLLLQGCLSNHSVRCMHAVVWKVHGYCFKKSVFYKEKKVPNTLEASTEGLKYIFNAKTIF